MFPLRNKVAVFVMITKIGLNVINLLNVESYIRDSNKYYQISNICFWWSFFLQSLHPTILDTMISFKHFFPSFLYFPYYWLPWFSQQRVDSHHKLSGIPEKLSFKTNSKNLFHPGISNKNEESNFSKNKLRLFVPTSFHWNNVYHKEN